MKSICRFNALILIISILINAFANNILKAQPVDTVQAKQVAKNFFADRLSRSKQMKLKAISAQNLEMFLIHEENEIISNTGNLKNSSHILPVYYIFNVRDKIKTKDKNGFVIVSADQRIPAILGYSFTGEFPENDMPPALKDWMNHYKEQIIYIIQNNIEPGPEIIDKWQKFSSTVELKSAEQLSEVAPLLTTLWSQYGYYNNLCPADISCVGALNRHVPAGCVAVAMAQIMKYWNYPASNNPIPGYTSDNYGWQPDISVTTYDWSSMFDAVDFGSTPSPGSAEINAVSTLIYHCGVAVQMKYGPAGSGANSPVNAFKNYFKYSPDILEIDKSDFSDSEWEDKIRNELENSRPVYYSGYANEMYGGGHAFVCDGYQNENYFHFNFGLSLRGLGNGYFYLNDLTPGSHNYNFKQWATVSISPSSPLVDTDGNYYDVVEIGSQVWMAENLKTTKYNDGTPIANVTGDNAWMNLSTDAYCWYNNDAATYKNTYGALYNWYAVSTGHLCPTGWHVPWSFDWIILENYLIANGYNYDGSTTSGNNYAKALASTTLWEYSEYTGAVGNTDYPSKRNVTGFTAVPSGYRSRIGPFGYVGMVTSWWSSSRYNADYPGERGMAYTTPNLNWGGDGEQTGKPVRCLRDATKVIIPVDAGAFVFGYISNETPGEEQWYKFLTGAAGTYAIQTYGSTDTYMVLYNSDRTTVIAEDNDGAGSGHNAKIAQNLNADNWYYVKISGYNHSTGSYSIRVNVLPADPIPNHVTATYNGLTQTADASVPPGISIVWYDAASGGTQTTQPHGINYGCYSAYAEAVNEATGCTSALRTQVTLTINPAPLTIKANDSEKYCGQMNPVFSVIYNGFVNGENESVLSGTLSFSSNANEDIGIGTYSIDASGLTSDNYAITFMPGILTIKDVSVDVSESSKPVPVGSFSITLSAKVSNASLISVPGVKVWFSVENGNNQITISEAVFTDGSGIANLTLIGLTSVVDVFKVTAIAGSGCGNAATSIAYLAIYDPNGGFVTGGGWINSPSGAYHADPALTGKANFEFVSKYKKGSNVPDGNTKFKFPAGNLNFNSSSYDLGSLVIGEFKAIYKGTGTINGTGSYRFMVSAVDGDVSGGDGYDMFRIKIWNKTDNSIVYDNNPGRDENDVPLTTLDGGSIVLHKANGKKSNLFQTPEFGLNVYPNPFTDNIYFELQLMTDSKVLLEIVDIKGSKIATVFDDLVVAYDLYRFEYAPENLYRGLLSYRLIVDGQQMFSGILIHK